MDLGEEVAHHWQVERLCHAGNLHPVGDAAHAQEIDHDDVHRARLDHVSKRRDTVHTLSSGQWSRQRIGHTGKASIVVMHGHVFEPKQIKLLDTPSDVDSLIEAPTLIDIAHEIDVGTDRFAN